MACARDLENNFLHSLLILDLCLHLPHFAHTALFLKPLLLNFILMSARIFLLALIETGLDLVIYFTLK